MTAQEIEDIYALTPLQAGMVYHTVLEPESRLYFEQILAPFAGPVDRALLERASARVAQHNSILRTSFHWRETDKPVQLVHRQARIPVTFHDLGGVAPDQRDARVAELMARDRRDGFDLARPPLIRIGLIRLQPDSHLMLLSFHHAILDGWSLQQLFRQLSDAYVALSQGQEPQLPPTKPFRDYVRWLNRQDSAAAQRYWQRTLSGFEGASRLPLRAQQSDDADNYGAAEAELASETTGALRQFAARHTLTLNTLVQAAWALLLHKMTGADDVVFGATVSGRPSELGDIDTMMGLFINTVPVRVRITPEVPCVAWLKQLQAAQFEARQYDFSSLVQIHEWANLPTGTPLFDTIIAFENYPVQARAGGAAVEATFVERTNYPLSACVVPGERLKVRLLYDRRFLTDRAVGGLARQYCRIIGCLIGGTGRLDQLDFVADEDLTLVTAMNDTRAEYPADVPLPKLFERQVSAAPDAPAIAFDDRALSYGELDARANQLAHHLLKLGVCRGAHVCLLLQPGLELIVAMLAVLKAGAAYVPLDASYPPARIDEIIADTRACLLIFDAQTVALHSASPVPTLVLEQDWRLIGNAPTTPPPCSAGGTDVAYVMFTSGSTGQPKGVAIPHQAIVALIRNTDYIDLKAGSRIAQASNCGFDAATFEIWGALLNGGTIVGIARDTLLSPALLAASLRQQRIDVLFLTTALFNQTVLYAPDAFSSLQVLIFGGEAVDPRRVREVLEAGPPRHLLHAYGPTESTTFATIHAVTDADRQAATVPIGRPIANTTAYVLDGNMRPVAPLHVGELHLGGDRLAHGYHRHPALTAERFIPDPFSCVPGARLYRTGDKVRWLGEEGFEFIGRYDHQVKLRGYRIELGEIEQRLLQLPVVREAVALLRQDARGEPLLIAYVVPGDQKENLLPELQAALRRYLPGYMQPAIVLLPSLPLNQNGKLDRSALPEPLLGNTAAENRVPPRTDLERRLATIWQQVLGQPEPHVHDGFFELGGNSLRATQLVSRICREFGIEIPLRAVFDRPTIAEQAALLEAEKATPAAAPSIIGRAARERRVL